MKHFSKHFKLILKTKGSRELPKYRKKRKEKKHETADNLVLIQVALSADHFL